MDVLVALAHAQLPLVGDYLTGRRDVAAWLCVALDGVSGTEHSPTP
jgi:hypothetical protein